MIPETLMDGENTNSIWCVDCSWSIPKVRVGSVMSGTQVQELMTLRSQYWQREKEMAAWDAQWQDDLEAEHQIHLDREYELEAAYYDEEEGRDIGRAAILMDQLDESDPQDNISPQLQEQQARQREIVRWEAQWRDDIEAEQELFFFRVEERFDLRAQHQKL